MSARDELAELLEDTVPQFHEYADAFGEIADVLLAAGYSKPRTITTVDELDALPYGTVVLDAERVTATKLDADYWEVAGFASHFRVEAIDLPVTVIYSPEES